MRMNLKNKKKLAKNLFTKKNYFIFLSSFFIVSIIIGIFFFLYLNSNDKNNMIANINNYFTINNNYNYLNLLLDSLKSNLFNTILIWILGISVLGSLYNLNILFLEGFSIGFIITSIFKAYKFKGLIGSFCFLFPSKIVYVILIFILTYFSTKFSFNIIENLFLKKEVSLIEKMQKYIKILFISLVLSIICSLFEVFISPIMIKLFTFFIK